MLCGEENHRFYNATCVVGKKIKGRGGIKSKAAQFYTPLHYYFVTSVKSTPSFTMVKNNINYVYHINFFFFLCILFIYVFNCLSLFPCSPTFSFSPFFFILFSSSSSFFLLFFFSFSFSFLFFFLFLLIFFFFFFQKFPRYLLIFRVALLKV